VPRERRVRGDDFCCEGCARVFELIHDTGLERFYDLRSRRTAPPHDLRPDNFAWLDRLRDETVPAEDGTLRLALDVQGVHCAACVWLLQELFRRAPGGVLLHINPSLGQADILWNPAEGDLRDYVREAERFGYRLGPRRKTPSPESRGLLVRLAVCAAAAINAMIFSLCFYFGLAPRDGILHPFFGWLNFGLGTVAVVAGGWIFIRGAWRGIRRGVVHLDLPVATGVVLAWAGSVQGHLTIGPEAAYFDSLTVFIALMVLGRWIQERLLERNRRTLFAGDGLSGLTTRRVRDGRVSAVPASDVDEGDEIWVVPGDLVAVDGILLERPASISLDWISGESRPRTLEPGARVPAGSFNAGDSAMRLTALEPFRRSSLHDLLPAEPESRDGRRPSPRWWHRVGTVWVAGVLLLAAAGFLAWLPHGPPRALAVTVSILVVTCPCALGLATPLAHDLVHAALRRRGVFLRSRTFLDRALGVRKVLFDKTGTLTHGRLALAERSRQALAALTDEERRVLFDLTIRSNHPVSRCLVRELGGSAALGVRLVDDEPVREIPGRGLEWSLRGTRWRLGSPEFAGEPEDLSDSVTRAAFAREGELVALFDFEEDLREDAAREVAALADDGLEIHLLSGDTEERAKAAARALGIPVERARGGLHPAAKADRVRRLDRGDTLMVGDGLNDAPSFAAAACAGTPAVDHPALPARADFYFLGEGIAAVRSSLRLARRLRTVVRDNLVFAAAYNAIALGLCFAGLVRPVVAAVLMPISSALLVTWTASRLSERRLRWR
jgi:Cu2+-exporting ATPase